MSAGLGRDPSAGDDSPDEMHEINVTSFIDVMLVLLIIVMIAAPLAVLAVSVPGSLHPDRRLRYLRPCMEVIYGRRIARTQSFGC